MLIFILILLGDKIVFNIIINLLRYYEHQNNDSAVT